MTKEWLFLLGYLHIFYLYSLPLFLHTFLFAYTREAFKFERVCGLQPGPRRRPTSRSYLPIFSMYSPPLFLHIFLIAYTRGAFKFKRGVLGPQAPSLVPEGDLGYLHIFSMYSPPLFLHIFLLIIRENRV